MGDILQQTYGFLKPLYSSQDVNQPAYQAFFDGVDLKVVQEVFRLIATGPNIIVNGTTTQVAIFCISDLAAASGWGRNGEFAACIHSDGITFRNAIAICPNFFRIPLRNGICATVNTGRTAMVTGPPPSQYANLVVALADVYTRQKNLRNATIPIQNINDCINLTPSQKLGNPTNYLFYAASKGHTEQHSLITFASF